MIKFCKGVLGTLMAIVCIAAISGSTLFIKDRYDQAIEAAVQARLAERGQNADLELPDLSRLEEVPGRQKVVSAGYDPAAAKAIIDEALRDASPEEREIWVEELKQRSPQEIREILALRNRFSVPISSIPDSEVEFVASSSESEPPKTLPEMSVSQANPLPADSQALIASSIEAIQTAEQVILNNIANANTIGFKRSRVLFGDLAYRQTTQPGQTDNRGRITTTGVSLGSGIGISATQVDVSQGRLKHTRQSLDLTIQGDGYFQINDENEFLYTRVGSFSVNANGQIVLVSKDCGRVVEPAITIPQDTIQISIGHDGIVSVQQQGQTLLNQMGNIQLARFINPLGLVAKGDNLFRQSTASGHPTISTPGQDGLGEIRQEYLEESNVSIDDELADLRRLREQLKALRQLHTESADPAW
ncbi:MAG TPA: flagellar hook-basal body complex protein [Planctomycetaceae bacterium]|jgi:flagellar basal-body rod protein FlgG